MDVVQNKSGTVDFIAPLDEPLPTSVRDCPAFDFILCTEVMEHVTDWKTSFENFATLLAPGGRVLITCPHFYPLHEAPYDFWRPTPFAIESFAKKSGLKMVHVEQIGGPWEVLGTLLAETHCYPATSRLIDRLAAKLGRIVRRLVNCTLLSGWWKSRVVLKGPYFLSVTAILEKPCPESSANRMGH